MTEAPNDPFFIDRTPFFNLAVELMYANHELYLAGREIEAEETRRRRLRTHPTAEGMPAAENAGQVVVDGVEVSHV